MNLMALAGFFSLLEHHPDTPRLLVRSLVRAHTKEAINICINKQTNKTDVSLPLPLSLSKNQ